VVLFHRVLDEDDPRWPYADKEWSVSARFFSQCLSFFQKHYHIVGLDDVRAAMHGSRGLPSNALLITFDDGWSDTLQYALPLMQQAGVKEGVLFVTVGAIGERILSWQETLFSRWLHDGCHDQDLAPLFALAEAKEFDLRTEADVRKLTALLQSRPIAVQDEVRAWCHGHLLAGLPPQPLMLSENELQALHAAGFALGTHGLRHEALTQVEHPRRQLAEAAKLLARMVPGCIVASMSYPLGRLSPAVVADTLATGYEAIFTGIQCLNREPCVAGSSRPQAIFGRLNISQRAFSDPEGNLCPALLATDLFRRETRSLGTGRGCI
jgi:peptidoglycan/xylan/chitin deacetylase (PgdA/CDA1 family)